MEMLDFGHTKSSRGKFKVNDEILPNVVQLCLTRKLFYNLREYRSGVRLRDTSQIHSAASRSHTWLGPTYTFIASWCATNATENQMDDSTALEACLRCTGPAQPAAQDVNLFVPP